MNKYQIVEQTKKFQHAGSKAREDVAYFAEQSGYEPVVIKCHILKGMSVFERAFKYFKPLPYWIGAFFRIRRHSVVLLQNPFYNRQAGREQCLKLLKKIKKCSIISVIHDAEFLRGSLWSDKNTQNEFDFMESNSDLLIVHNELMKKAFSEKGIDENRLIPLEIFDYRTDGEIPEKKPGENTADIIVAGNLRRDKCPYIYLLSHLENGFSVNLYGPNYGGNAENTQIKYNGSFPSEKIPEIIDGKFGLIWDGDSADGCNGETGNYLRYNNPHKTSLYLVAGIPVVIWKEAAMARFVEKENVGICVNSLNDIKDKIDAVTDEEYKKMLENVNRIAGKLEKGYYLKTALKKCEDKFCTEQRGN